MSRTSKYYKKVEPKRLVVELEKEMYYTAELAEILGVSAANLSVLAKQGKFIEFDKRIGNRLYYTREKILDWLANSYRPQLNSKKRRSNRKKESDYTQMNLLEENKE